MIKSKLIKLLGKFSKSEMKEFEKFISSPFFSRGRNLKPLFSLLYKHHPDFSSSRFTEEKIYKKLYPDKKFEKKSSSHALQVIASEMTSLAEKFLVYSGFESGERKYYYNIFLAESYRDKDLTDPVIKLLIRNSELLDKDEINHDYYIRRLETNMSISGVFLTGNQSKEGYEYSKKNFLYIYAYIFDIMNKYVNDYFVNRYSYNIEHKGFSVIKKFVEAFDPELFSKECEEDDFETGNLALINYHIIKSRFDEGDMESLLKAMDIFVNIFDKLPRFTKWHNYVLLFNRLFGRIRFDRFYLDKANELTDLVWGKGIFSTQKKINLHIGSYHSAMMVKAAILRSNEFLEFIEKYSGNVDPVYAGDIRDYSYAFFYFKGNLFEKCLQLVSQKDSLVTPSIKINKHKLKICCLYELGHSEEAISAIDSFEHFLRNNKNVSEIVKTENLKFVTGIKIMIRIKHGEITDPELEIAKIIELNKNSVFGYWFEEKIKK